MGAKPWTHQHPQNIKVRYVVKSISEGQYGSKGKFVLHTVLVGTRKGIPRWVPDSIGVVDPDQISIGSTFTLTFTKDES